MQNPKQDHKNESHQNESQPTEEYNFLHETIKLHNTNKRYLVWRVFRFIILGIFFGMFACIGFYTLQPVMQNLFHTQEEPPRITLPPLTEDPTVTNPEDPGDSSTTAPPHVDDNSVGDDTSQGDVIVEIPPMTQAQYLELLDDVGERAVELGESIVMIHAIDSESNLQYENDIITQSSTGVIVYKTDDVILIVADNSLSSNHTSWMVTFANNKVYHATLRQQDLNRGLAIYQVLRSEVSEDTYESISVVNMGNSQSMRRGDFVLALGNLSGLGNGFSFGMITTREYRISFVDSRHSVLTTDIPAAQEGSGALFNQRGELVGFILPRLNLSVDTNTANAVGVTGLRSVIEFLSNNEAVPYVGVQGMTISEQVYESTGIPVGMFITNIITDSPAMRAGLQNGDVITRFHNVVIQSMNMFQLELLSMNVGDTVQVEAMRRGADGYEPIVFTVTLGVYEP